MPKIVTIQDLSCFGKCSLTVALPLLSAMGAETAVLPTAILSTHTLFPGAHCMRLDAALPKISEHWSSLGLRFDVIYSGYLASESQVRFVIDFFHRFSDNTPLRFVDPAMADNGRLYSGFSPSFPAVMAQLCAAADIIAPNLTEAALLSGIAYRESYDEDYLRDVLEALIPLGTRQAIVLTGVSAEAGQTGVYGLDLRSHEFFSYSHEKCGAGYHGTGDIFSSVTVGALAKGLPLRQSLSLAADFTVSCIKASQSQGQDSRCGICFEPEIPMLLAKLSAAGV